MKKLAKAQTQLEGLRAETRGAAMYQHDMLFWKINAGGAACESDRKPEL